MPYDIEAASSTRQPRVLRCECVNSRKGQDLPTSGSPTTATTCLLPAFRLLEREDRFPPQTSPSCEEHRWCGDLEGGVELPTAVWINPPKIHRHRRRSRRLHLLARLLSPSLSSIGRCASQGEADGSSGKTQEG